MILEQLQNGNLDLPCPEIIRNALDSIAKSRLQVSEWYDNQDQSFKNLLKDFYELVYPWRVIIKASAFAKGLPCESTKDKFIWHVDKYEGCIKWCLEEILEYYP